ncbi:MAG: CidA/LrgA family protein [Bacteroidales bacterium]|nr:CidA/LrgA family protein [Bacteroidales bacterium]
MKLVKQFLIILAFSFAGEILHALLPLPIPASIYGIALLFTALQLRVVKVSDIAETSAFLIEIMPIMFIPAAVGLLKSWDVVKDSLAAYVAVTVVSTFVVMYAAGVVTQIIIRRGKRREGEQDA